MSKLKKQILHGQVKKDSFYRQILLSFRRDFAPLTRQFFAPSLYILYAAHFNYLIRWVIVTYILLDISVVNSHATSAHECELLTVTWHYLPSVQLHNGGSVIGRDNSAYSLPMPCILFTRPSHFLRVLNLSLRLFSSQFNCFQFCII